MVSPELQLLVPRPWLEGLADGENVASRNAQAANRFRYLVRGLADADHQAALDQHGPSRSISPALALMPQDVQACFEQELRRTTGNRRGTGSTLRSSTPPHNRSHKRANHHNGNNDQKCRIAALGGCPGRTGILGFLALRRFCLPIARMVLS